MATFHLYRLKIERREETPSLFDNPSRPAGEIILSAIEEKPSKELRKDQLWRIGNVQKLSSNEVFFALGKITKMTQDLYDKLRGDFVKRPFDQAPHTYVAVDLKFQVCAIAYQPKIAPKTDSIAKNLALLLSQSMDAQSGHLSFTLSTINNPEEFLTLIRNAVRISDFEMTFSRPNPFDVNRQFQEPMERLLQATNADKGKTAIKGEKLEPKVIEDLTRAVAARGNEAKARIQPKGEVKFSRKHLSGNPLTVRVAEIIRDENKRLLFKKMYDAYCYVRGPEQKA